MNPKSVEFLRDQFEEDPTRGGRMPATHDYSLTRDYGGGITRSMTLGGQASLDEIIDAFRAMLVLMGYHTSVAERLVLVAAVAAANKTTNADVIGLAPKGD